MLKREITAVSISILVIVIAAILQHRSRYLAGFISVMPLKVIAVIWIVWVSNHDLKATIDVSLGMISGVIATAVFLIVCVIMFRLNYSFHISIGVASTIWFFVALSPQLFKFLFNLI